MPHLSTSLCSFLSFLLPFFPYSFSLSLSFPLSLPPSPPVKQHLKKCLTPGSGLTEPKVPILQTGPGAPAPLLFQTRLSWETIATGLRADQPQAISEALVFELCFPSLPERNYFFGKRPSTSPRCSRNIWNLAVLGSPLCLSPLKALKPACGLSLERPTQKEPPVASAPPELRPHSLSWSSGLSFEQ